MILLVVGMTAAALASRRAVGAALDASAVSRIPAGAIGATVVAVGTDLPEIANSIMAALTDHGDLVLGDAAGSAMTQVTLVLGILLFLATLTVERRSIGSLGVLTVLGLFLVAVLVSDGEVSRLDGVLLIAAWVVGLILTERARPAQSEPQPARVRHALPHALRAVGWLGLVGVSAAVVVRSFVEVTDELGVPELVASAVVLSLGTSLPELIVDWTAIRRGSSALALGDLFGSSFLDATLAVGIGPALRSVPVSPEASGLCVIAAVGVAIATALVVARRRSGRSTGVVLIAVWALCSVALVAYTGLD